MHYSLVKFSEFFMSCAACSNMSETMMTKAQILLANTFSGQRYRIIDQSVTSQSINIYECVCVCIYIYYIYKYILTMYFPMSILEISNASYPRYAILC